ncbi:MAG: electron transfer flavoprotein subunit alpha/FixB family protein [Dehalococcoidia bacterium]
MTEPLYRAEEASGLWVFLEQQGGILEPVSLELLGKARQLADESQQVVTGVLLGHEISPLAIAAVAYGADEVLLAEHALLRHYTTDPYTKVMAELILERTPDILLLGATPNGRDLAGRLAVRLRTGLTADCTDLTLDQDGLLLGQVTGFGRGILAGILCPEHRPQMATVRPGVFPRLAPALAQPPSGRIQRVDTRLSQGDAPVRVVRHSTTRGGDITAAERLVIGGRGVEGNFDILRELAALINADVGATRVAVDEEWVDREAQIGQTGYVTRPKLAIVCGVSGAMQFTVGIQDAETVVAINSDPEAPIFEAADYCIVDDLFQVLPSLIEALRRQRENGGS